MTSPHQPRLPAGGSEREALRRLSWLLAALLLVAYGYHWRVDAAVSWNVATRLGLIRAVFHDRSLQLRAADAAVTGDKAEYPPGSGRFYCDKPVGAQVPGLAGYAVGYAVAALVSTDPGQRDRAATALATWAAAGLPTLILALFMLPLLRTLAGDLPRAVVVTLAYCLATLAFPYSTVLYGHQPAAALGMLGFIAAFAAVGARGSDGLAQRNPVRPALALVAGLLAGWAMVTEFPAGMVFLIIGAYAARAGWRTALLYLLGAIPPITLQLAYNWACFESPFRFGYMFEHRAEFSEAGSWVHLPRLDALWGLTFSPEKGLLVMSPFLLAAAWGLGSMLRDRRWRAEGLVCAAVSAGYLLYNAGHYMWEGGYCFGPRHLVVMLPFLCTGLTFALPRMRGPAGWLLGAALGWSALVMFAATSVLAAPPIHGVLFGGDCPREALAQLWRARLLGPNLGTALGLSPAASLVAHAAALAALCAAVWWSVRRGAPASAERTGGPREQAPLPPG